MPTLTGKEVNLTGCGLMGLTWRQNPVTTDEAIKTMRTALAQGSNFWNGGEIYGTPTYNSLHLLKQYFTENPADAEKVVLSIKGAIDPEKHIPDGSEAGIKRSMDACLAGLDGKKFLDIFECARVDPNTPIEDTIGYLAKYVKEGKLGGISLSEVKAETIRRAAKVHQIVAVEVELSLWATDILENGIAAACAELHIPVVAYSPLGRGFLTGQIKKPEDIPEDSMLRRFPRFQKGNFDQNLWFVDELEKISKNKGCTPAQLALAWVKQLNGKPGMPTIIPIPGATTEKRVIENMKDVKLTEEEISEINAVIKKAAPAGARYGPPFDTLMNG